MRHTGKQKTDETFMNDQRRQTMTTVYTLKQIFPAMKNASDQEVRVMQDGMRMVTDCPDETPLMKLKYALSDPALDVVRRYADIA